MRERELADFGAPPVAGPPDADAAIDWIHRRLRVPTGPLAGRPFVLPDWQQDWVRGALAPGMREAGLSVARKNGKSGLIAAVILAALAGPLNRPGWRGVVSSLTANLAKELRDAIEQTARMSELLHSVKVIRAPAPGYVTGNNGAKVDFLAADKSSGHALGADIAILDEAGLLPEAKRFLWNALYTSMSGRNGRFWAISVQGDGPMFAEMEAAAGLGADNLHWAKWAAPMKDKAGEMTPLDDEVSWHAANPGLIGGIKSIEYMRDAAQRAITMPGNELHFRAWDLNQPVDPERVMIVSVSDYRKCVTSDAPTLEGDIVVGLDLGSTVSMTCAVAYSPSNGAILVRGAFPEEPPLAIRAKNDRMGTAYDRMVRAGELALYPGRVTPVVPFLVDFLEEVGQHGIIVALGADRHRRAEAEMAFRDAGLERVPVAWRGQGASTTADGSADVRAFQRAIIERKISTAGSPMLEAAIASSVLRFDGAGNPAIDKAANNARIDALSAGVIAAGLGERLNPLPLFEHRVHVL
ncbi:MAG: terminase large subunit [Rhodospirillaceae bacterium]|nr:terminase large subunit [Rhodospirillaceae bacterium]